MESGRPRIISVVSKDAEERLPPDEDGVLVLESYVPAGSASSQVAGVKPPVLQPLATPQPTKTSEKQKPAISVFGSLLSKIRSLFGR